MSQHNYVISCYLGSGGLYNKPTSFPGWRRHLNNCIRWGVKLYSDPTSCNKYVFNFYLAESNIPFYLRQFVGDIDENVSDCLF